MLIKRISSFGLNVFQNEIRHSKITLKSNLKVDVGRFRSIHTNKFQFASQSNQQNQNQNQQSAQQQQQNQNQQNQQQNQQQKKHTTNAALNIPGVKHIIPGNLK